MARSPYPHINHHMFNHQGPDHQSPLVQCVFRIEDIYFSAIAMLDSGCSTCIIPLCQLPKEAKKHIAHTDVRVKGINGSITAFGELTSDVTIGSFDSPTLEG